MTKRLEYTGMGFKQDGSCPILRGIFRDNFHDEGNGRELWYGVTDGRGYGDGKDYGDGAGDSDHRLMYPFELIQFWK